MLATLLLLAAPVQEAQPPSSATQAPKPKVLGVDVTFLANQGFFLESGRYSILIDAFVREATSPYAALPSEVHKQLANAKPPFDGLTIVLVSHEHQDHVQMRGLEKYLEHNSQAQLMTSPEILKGLRAAARDFEAIQRRISPIPTVPGTMNKILHEEMSIEFFELRHAGKPNAEVLNLAHLIELGGLRLLHVGDAEPTVDNFSRYDLDKRAIDVAIVPYWFFSSPEAVQTLKEEIKARHVVVCHVPPPEWDKLNELLKAQFPEVILFKDALEKRHFEASPPAAGESGG